MRRGVPGDMFLLHISLWNGGLRRFERSIYEHVSNDSFQIFNTFFPLLSFFSSFRPSFLLLFLFPCAIHSLCLSAQFPFIFLSIFYLILCLFIVTCFADILQCYHVYKCKILDSMPHYRCNVVTMCSFSILFVSNTFCRTEMLDDPDLEHPCNLACNCTTRDFIPMCGSDGVVYFSPCHAGCTTEQTDPDDTTVRCWKNSIPKHYALNTFNLSNLMRSYIYRSWNFSSFESFRSSYRSCP